MASSKGHSGHICWSQPVYPLHWKRSNLWIFFLSSAAVCARKPGLSEDSWVFTGNCIGKYQSISNRHELPAISKICSCVCSLPRPLPFKSSVCLSAQVSVVCDQINSLSTQRWVWREAGEERSGLLEDSSDTSIRLLLATETWHPLTLLMGNLYHWVSLTGAPKLHSPPQFSQHVFLLQTYASQLSGTITNVWTKLT